MSDQLARIILQQISQVSELYYHLVLLIAAAGEARSTTLEEAARQVGLNRINVSLELSRRMLDLSTRQRALRAASLLDDVINEEEGDAVLLDNIELLFSPALRQDPLRLLQNLSRRKQIVAIWNGKVDRQYLTYGEPDHAEYRRYLTTDLVILNLEERG